MEMAMLQLVDYTNNLRSNPYLITQSLPKSSHGKEKERNLEEKKRRKIEREKQKRKNWEENLGINRSTQFWKN